MSTVKITALASKTLASNTANTIFVGVDLPTGVTGKYTAKELADNLYSNNVLNVGNTIAFADGTTQNTSFTAVASYANGAFIQANAAFLVANTPDAIANSAALYANGAFIQANAAFLVANTPTHVANSAALYANGAFIQANAAFLRANTPDAIANSAALYANGAFAKANSALANTSGTFAGNLNITGNLSLLNGSLESAGNMTVNGTMVLANSNFLPTQAALTITASPTVATPSNDGYMLHISGKQNVVSRIVADSYGANSYVVFAGRTARGNVTNPSAVQSGDVLMRVSGNGYGATGYAPIGVGRIDIVASENHTDSARGTQIKFWNMPTGTNTLTNIATFNGESAVFTGVVSPQKGFIYTPRVLSAQTAITIDFATDSMIKTTYSSTLTVSFSNYTYGKVVELWVTNTAGTGQTINLGVLANNSTTGSTTLSVASNRSAKLQYFSVDGDLANTFCAITYA